MKDTERKHEQEAADFCKAIRIFAEHPDRIDNLESYLTHCFTAWLEKYANTPENIAAEMLNFANME